MDSVQHVPQVVEITKNEFIDLMNILLVLLVNGTMDGQTATGVCEDLRLARIFRRGLFQEWMSEWLEANKDYNVGSMDA